MVAGHGVGGGRVVRSMDMDMHGCMGVWSWVHMGHLFKYMGATGWTT